MRHAISVYLYGIIVYATLVYVAILGSSLRHMHVPFQETRRYAPGSRNTIHVVCPVDVLSTLRIVESSRNIADIRYISDALCGHIDCL